MSVIVQINGADRYYAVCNACGWSSPERERAVDAEDELWEHEAMCPDTSAEGAGDAE